MILVDLSPPTEFLCFAADSSWLRFILAQLLRAPEHFLRKERLGRDGGPPPEIARHRCVSSHFRHTLKWATNQPGDTGSGPAERNASGGTLRTARPHSPLA